jgi:IS30 family transposase
MARCKLTIAERWQAIRMSNTGMSSRNIAVQFNVNHTVIGRLIQRYHQTGTVNDRPSSGRPRLTSPREDILLTRRANKIERTLAARWPGRVSVRTVIRRLHNTHLRARRPVKRPYLSPHHRQARLQWANDHLRWNIRNWQKIH